MRVSSRSVVVVMVFFLLAVSVAAMPIYVRPIVDGALRPGVTFNYTLNFTSDADCSDVLLSNSTLVVPDVGGIGFIDVDTSSLSASPNFLCEYRDGVLRKVHAFPRTFLSSAVITNLTVSSINASSYCDSSGCHGPRAFFDRLNASDQRYNESAAVEARLNITDQRYNDSVAIDARLNITDQRYNDTAAVDARLNASDQRYNETISVGVRMNITDQRYNDTAAIAVKLDASDQRYNGSAEVVLRLNISDQRYNDSVSAQNPFNQSLNSSSSVLFGRISLQPGSSINMSGGNLTNLSFVCDGGGSCFNLSVMLNASDQRYNGSAEIVLRLNITDQRYNDTTAIDLKLAITDQRYNDTTAINLKLDITDQRYNDSVRNPFNQSLNTTSDALFRGLSITGFFDVGLRNLSNVSSLCDGSGACFNLSVMNASTAVQNPFNQVLNRTGDVEFVSVNVSSINASVVNASSFGGNFSSPETTRKGGIYSYTCSGTDKVSAIGVNGSAVCTADQTAAGGVQNPFNQSLNSSSSVLFGRISLQPGSSINMSGGNLTNLSMLCDGAGICFNLSVMNASTAVQNPFNQSLNRTSDVQFGTVNATSMNVTFINASFVNANFSLPRSTITGGVYSYSCAGTDKVSAIVTNGSAVCAADETGAAAVQNPFNQSLNSTSSVQFGRISLQPNSAINMSGGNLTNLSMLCDGANVCYNLSVLNTSAAAGESTGWSNSTVTTSTSFNVNVSGVVFLNASSGFLSSAYGNFSNVTALSANFTSSVASSLVNTLALFSSGNLSVNYTNMLFRNGTGGMGLVLYANLSAQFYDAVTAVSFAGNLSSPSSTFKGGIYSYACAGTDKVSAIGTNGSAVCAADQTVAGGTKMKTLVSGRSTAGLTVDGFFHPSGAQATTSAYDEELCLEVPFTGTIKNLTMWNDAAEGSGDLCAGVIRSISGSCTGTPVTIMNCTIAGVGLRCLNHTADAAVTAGDGITFLFDEIAGSCVSSYTWGFVLEES